MWYHIITLSLLTFSFSSHAAEQLYTNQPTVTPELAIAGKYAVGVATITATNPQQLSATDFTSLRDRALTLEVWYPAKVDGNAKQSSYKNVTRSHLAFELRASAFRDAPAIARDGKFPLVVLSHGYTGYRTIMFYLGEHLASHGYVVVGVDHRDSTNEDVDFSKSPGSGFASTLLNRARDQQFVMDYFSEGTDSLDIPVDTDTAAVIGYSMGGYGAINTVGGCYQFNKESLTAVGFSAEQSEDLQPSFNTCNAGQENTDRRWKAMIGFAPWGGEQGVHSAESLQAIKVPSLYVVGNLDDISGFNKGVKALFDKTAFADTFLMVYDNARHNIAAHPAPKVAYQNDLDIGHYYEPSWDAETINCINKHMSLAFLDCYLKQQQSGCEYLPVRENIAQTKQADGTMSKSWPGFKSRWGTGVSFIRK